MSFLHLLLPPLVRFDDAPSLKRWLARGDRLADAPRGREAALREVFQLPGASLPVAALLRQHLVHDAGEDVWLCADPAYVRAEAHGARLFARGDDLELTREEAEGLAQPLRPLFGDAGAPLEISTPAHWALRLPCGTPLPDFIGPEDALGVNLLECMPQGDAGRRWRALFNEAQIILHSHPLNAQRRARGQMPVNALWFWGAGALPMWVRSPMTRVSSDDALVLALFARASTSSGTIPAASKLAPAALEDASRGGDTLLDFFGVDAASIERDWLARMDDALRRGRARRIELAFASGERFRIRPWHRWRVWRRAS